MSRSVGDFVVSALDTAAEEVWPDRDHFEMSAGVDGDGTGVLCGLCRRCPAVCRVVERCIVSFASDAYFGTGGDSAGPNGEYGFFDKQGVAECGADHHSTGSEAASGDGGWAAVCPDEVWPDALAAATWTIAVRRENLMG